MSNLHDHKCPECGIIWRHGVFGCAYGTGYLKSCPEESHGRLSSTSAANTLVSRVTQTPLKGLAMRWLRRKRLALVLAAVTILCCWASVEMLTKDTHDVCVEGAGRECVEWETVAGAAPWSERVANAVFPWILGGIFSGVATVMAWRADNK